MTDVSSAVNTPVAAVAPIFDALTDLVAWFDHNCRYRFVNDAVARLLEIPASEYVGRTIGEMTRNPERATEWQIRLDEVVRTGQPAVFEFNVQTAAGLRRFQTTLSPVCEADGRVDSIVAISRDITNTRAARLLEGAIAQLPAGVSLVEAPTGRLLLRNSRALEIFRAPARPLQEGIPGYSAFTGFRLDGTPYRAEDWPVARSILTGEIVSGEIAHIERSDGTRGYIRMNSAPLRDAAGTILAALVTFEDISDNFEVLEHERAARTHAEAAVRARDDFVSAASHELRNPLNALQLQLTALRRALQRDPAALTGSAGLARLARAEAQIERLVRLTDNLLDLSTLRAGKLQLVYETVDLVVVARELADEFAVLGDDTIEVRCTATSIEGRWDRSRVDQVLTNLLSNAVKYGNRQPVSLQLDADEDRAVIRVTDRGIGIAPGDMDRLFAPFERLAPRRTGGFGLGLWITREIVTALRGSIDVTSDVGRGSTFTVTLPRWTSD